MTSALTAEERAERPIEKCIDNRHRAEYETNCGMPASTSLVAAEPKTMNSGMSRHGSGRRPEAAGAKSWRRNCLTAQQCARVPDAAHQQWR